MAIITLQGGVQFDPNAIDPYTGAGGKFPVGAYRVVIVNAETQQTRAGNGGFLALTMRITSGSHTGEECTHRLNLWNQNEKARDIAQRELSTICHVVGAMSAPLDTANLMNVEFIIKVAKVQPKLGEEDRDDTRIERWFDAAGVGPRGASRIDLSELDNEQGATQQQQPQQAAARMTTASDWNQTAQQPAQQPQVTSWDQQAVQQPVQQPAQQPVQQQAPATSWDQTAQQQQAPAQQSQQQAPFSQNGAASDTPPWMQ